MSETIDSKMIERIGIPLRGQNINNFETPHFRACHEDRAFVFNLYRLGESKILEQQQVINKLVKHLEDYSFMNNHAKETILNQESKIQDQQQVIDKLVEGLSKTMGCAYIWDEHYPEKEHDENCDVCKLLSDDIIKKYIEGRRGM